MQQNRLPLSGAVLKNIACLTMLVDHFFASVFDVYIQQCRSAGQDVSGLLTVQNAGRAIGRMAFVLFAFLLAEGFAHTHSRVRYTLRLGLFALLSEVPFDLAIMGRAPDWSHQNIFFTLTDGLLVLIVWRWMEECAGAVKRAEGDSVFWSLFCRCMQWGALLAGCTVAYFLNFDYCHMGVLLIFVFYVLRDRPAETRILPVACTMFCGNLSILWLDNILRWDGIFTIEEMMAFSLPELYGLAAFVPIGLYNGARGRQPVKWVYYAYYPLHLLLLYGVTAGLFGTAAGMG